MVPALLPRGRETTPPQTLARFFDTSAEFWVNLQTAYEIETQSKAPAPELATIEPRQMEAA